MSSAGTLYGLGVGPGDPELITLKALRLLRAAPVVAYPAPEHGESFARAIVATYLSPALREIAIRIPMRPGPFPAEEVYNRAATALAAELAAGRDVATLCQGDPFFYGSFMYLFARLATRFRAAVVPGVSSLMASASALGAPLAAREDVLSVVPAPLPEEAMAARLRDVEAAAIIKLGRHFAKVRALLERLGLAERARYIEHASLSSERILAHSEVDPAAVPYFSTILLHRRGEAWR